MNLSGSHTFDTDQETLWAVLMDPRAIAEALPGVAELKSIEGEANAWRAEANIAVVSANDRVLGTIRLSDISPPNHYRLTLDGEGQQTVVNGFALIRLECVEATGQTILRWQADFMISDKLAGLDQRLIKAAAALLSKRFFRSLTKQISTFEMSD